MKVAQKTKKQKALPTKSPLDTQTKKLELKKTSLKKQDVSSKYYSSAQLTKATNTGLTSGTQTTKHIQTITKNPSKASLADIKQVHSQKIFPAKYKIQKPILVDKAKQQIKKSLANVIKSYYPQKKTCLDISMTEVTKDATQKQQKVSRNDFNFLYPIGQGGYGKVWKVQKIKNKKQYAMKEMSRSAIIMKKSVDNVINELKILETIRNNFIANIQFAFHDRDNLYLVMDLLPGGDLRYHIGQIQKFTQDQTKFLIGCIVTAVQYIHLNKIFHRDIKPQNLVFDQNGYLKLTDFGIARIDTPKNILDASGTPGYMAPQVLCKQVHSFPVDFYAIGVIAYELMLGKRPFYGNNRNQIRDAVLAKQHAVKKSQIPKDWSVDSADFVNKLIIRQPGNRLGTKNGVKQLKNHPWFKGFKWNELSQHNMKSPFNCKKHLIEVEQNLNFDNEALMQLKLLQKAQQKLDPFSKYYFHVC